MLASLKLVAISAVVALVVGFGGGWKVRDAFCDAAEQRAKVESLQRQVDAHEAADKANAELAAKQATEISNLEQTAYDLRGKISAGECFTADDVGWLRRLWPDAK